MTFDLFGARQLQSLRHGLRAFRHRNYCLFFFGQGVSVIGTWMQATALPWMVFAIRHSEADLGIVAFATQVPMALLAPFAGALSDRMNRRPILILTQTVAMLQAFILAAIAFAGTVMLWHIVVLALLIGLVMAFDMPTRQSFVVEMVGDKRDIPSAIALNSLMFNSGRFIGAAIGGVMIALWHPGWIFFVNGVSYLAIIVSYFLMKLHRREFAARRPHILHDIAEGFVYVFRHRAIRAVLLTLAFMSLAGMSYATLLPAFAKNVLHGGPGAYGLLVASTGAGAILAGLYLATRKDSERLARKVLLAAAVLSAGVTLFAFSPWLYVSAALLLVTGFCGMVMIAGSNTLLQTLVHDDKRGRLMGLYGLCFLGVAPFGSLFVGAVAENKRVGPQWTLFACGLLCLIVLALLGRTLLAAHAAGETAPQAADAPAQAEALPPSEPSSKA
jgi:MFS family permease